MIYDIQKASALKRISAFLLDLVLFAILCVGIAWAVSAISGYDKYSDGFTAAVEKYEKEYNISFDDVDGLSDEEREIYDKAYEALSSDTEAMRNYGMTVNLIILEVTLGIVLGFFISEFIIPLLFKNGQSLGKKVFGLCVVRVDGVKLSNPMLFVRSMLGKCTVGVLVPILLITMTLIGIVSLPIGILTVGTLFIAQIAMFLFSANRTMLHDVMSGTVVVDKATQMIFNSADELLEYKKRIHAEEAEKSEY